MEEAGVLLLYTYSVYLGGSEVHIDECGVLQCAIHPALARLLRLRAEAGL